MSDAIEIEGWNNYRLDEIGVIYSGATPSTTNLSFWDGSIVWITPSDLSDLSTAYLFDSKKKITEKGLEACSAHYLPANSITLSSRAPIGYVAIPQTGFCTNQGCKSILLDNGFDPEFVYHNLCFNIDKLKRLGEGTTFAEISKTALATVSLSFPAEKDEQTQIATILSTIDRAIEQTETIIAKQQRIKTGLMQDLLTCGIDEQGNVRSEATHEFKDSPLGRIPVEWDISSIGNEFVVQLGKMLSKKALDGELFDYLGNRSVQWDFIDTSSLPKMHFSDSERRKFSLEYGDVLICEGGEVGRTAVWTLEKQDCYYQKAIHRLRPLSGEYNAFLLPYYMRHIIELGCLDDFISQTSIAHLTQEKLELVPLLVPPEKEQVEILAQLEKAGDLLSLELERKSKLEKTKTGLMQDLLTGKVRVIDLLNPPTHH